MLLSILRRPLRLPRTLRRDWQLTWTQFPVTEKHVTGVTITNPTVNGVYKMPNLLESAGTNRPYYWTEYKVEVTMEQAGKGTGAKGEAVIEDGKITSVTITHPGSGYDSDVATYPVTVTFRNGVAPFGLTETSRLDSATVSSSGKFNHGYCRSYRVRKFWSNIIGGFYDCNGTRRERVEDFAQYGR